MERLHHRQLKGIHAITRRHIHAAHPFVQPLRRQPLGILLHLPHRAAMVQKHLGDNVLHPFHHLVNIFPIHIRAGKGAQVGADGGETQGGGNA